MTRYGILGAGAMGSLFGGLLAFQGHDVTLIDINVRHLAAIAQDGLTLALDTGVRRVRLSACRAEQAVGPMDWLIVFTKTMHTMAALTSARHLIAPDTHLLSLQNGLGALERLQPYAPASRIAIGVTTVPADLCAPGHVRSHGAGSLRLMMADGQISESFSSLIADLTAVGFECTPDPTVQIAIWAKVAFNAALNGLCAVTGCTVGELPKHPDGRLLAHDIAVEAMSVAQGLGLAIDSASVHAAIDHALDRHTGHKPSMLQDLLLGRPTEIDAIHGEILRAGKRLGLCLPLTRSLYVLVQMREMNLTKKYQPTEE